MRPGVAAVLGALFMVACSQGATTSAPPSSPGSPSAASVDALTPYFGSYRSGSGDTVVIARLGWYFDMADSAYRTIYATAIAGRFTIGPGFLEPFPTFAVLRFTPADLTITGSGRTTVAHRIDYRQTDVTIPAPGATLAGSITEPPAAGPHPAIVVVHGAERGLRYFYDVWVGIYASLGLVVLTYDKRGSGASTGQYPGEFPTAAALATYADDAAVALNFLARWPGVDPKRTGFHGGSQGGWTVPLAIQRRPLAAFDVLASAPATTVDQTDLWAGFTNGGEVKPSESVG